MKLNVGGNDKSSRIIVGTALMAFAFFQNQPIAYVGIIPLMTGVLGFCPIYSIFKFSSIPDKKKKEK